MRKAVLDNFRAFTIRLEGEKNWMYLDIKGWVTVAWGCLIDPFTLAIHLPWIDRESKQPVSQDAAYRNWRRLKAALECRHLGAEYAKKYTTIELAPGGMAQLAFERLRLNEEYVLKHHFPKFEDYPADAQLGIMSMAWAMGAGGFADFPKFSHAAREEAWSVCARECFINAKNNPGLVPRNWANRKLFTRAATTETPDQITGWP